MDILKEIMSKKEKLIAKLRERRKDFTWDELTSLLKSLGYRESKKGKTGGSRRRFIHESAPTIILHSPYPQSTLKRYAIEQILEILEQENML